MTAPLSSLSRRLRRAWLAARYGVTIKPSSLGCLNGHGYWPFPASREDCHACQAIRSRAPYTAHTSRRLRSHEVEVVKRLTARVIEGEKRSNGDREAMA